MLFFFYLCNMIELSGYIEKLLLDHECVILPDLGGFVVRNEDSLTAEDGTFFPPYRSVGFNSQLVVNDGLLVQQIMQVYDTDYSSASRMLDESIQHIKEMLSADGCWKVGSIGVLNMTEEKTYEFVPSSQEIPSPSYYGLESFCFPLFSQVASEKLLPVEPESSVVEEEGNVSDTSAALPEEEKRNVVSLWGRYAKRGLRYAGVIVFAFLVFFATSIPVHNVSNVQTAKFSVLDGALYKFPVISHDEENEESDVVEKGAEESVAPVPAKKQNLQEEARQEEAPAQVVEAKDVYTIVLASQVRKSNAQDLVDRLAKEGYKDAEVYEGKNMIRVIYSSYKTETDAYNALKSLRKGNDAFDEAWVYLLK